MAKRTSKDLEDGRRNREPTMEDITDALDRIMNGDHSHWNQPGAAAHAVTGRPNVAGIDRNHRRVDEAISAGAILANLPLTDGQRAFADELSKLWSQGESQGERLTRRGCSCPGSPHDSVHFHSYEISNHRAWRSWRHGDLAGTKYQRAPRGTRQLRWWCDSLREAARHYSWAEKPGKGFSDLSSDLQRAMAAGNAGMTVATCVEIFRWGEVDKEHKNEQWLQAKGESIIADIKNAVSLLSPGCTSSLSSFDGGRLCMNSAMTKVYAAADPAQQVIIYDGRVGAALCLFIRHHLKQKGANEVPAELRFLWGPPQLTRTSAAEVAKRNPSDETFTFQKLRDYGVTDRRRAEVSRAASAILSAATHGCPLREIEKALFMIGYAVRSPWAITFL